MARYDPARPGDALLAFLTERHLASFTVVRPDGTPHVTPVGFTYDGDRRMARVITWADSWKARHVAAQPGIPAAICSVDGGRWVSLYGTAALAGTPEAIAEGVRRYAARYRPPKERSDRVVIELQVDRIVGNMP